MGKKGTQTLPMFKDRYIGKMSDIPVAAKNFVRREHRTQVSRQIRAWLAEGRVTPTPRDQVVTSPLLTVKKKDGGLRTCIDLRKVNGFTKTLEGKVYFPNVERIRRITRAKWFTKFDLKNAYLHIPLNDFTSRHMAFTWSNHSYRFKYLPFGARNAPCFFQRRITNTIIRRLYQDHKIRAVGYLDDFLIATATRRKCIAATRRLAGLLQGLGLTINHKKSSLTPSRTIDYLGYKLGHKTMRVPSSKKKAWDKSWARYAQHHRDTKRQRQLAGTLNFMSTINPHLNAFKLAATQGVLKPSSTNAHILRRMIFKHTWVPKSTEKHRWVKVTTDASDKGWATVTNEHTSKGSFGRDLLHAHISAKELDASIRGVQSLIDKGHQRIQLYTDAQAVQGIWKSWQSKSRGLNRVMKAFIVRNERWLRHGELRANYIPSAQNIADKPSRELEGTAAKAAKERGEQYPRPRSRARVPLGQGRAHGLGSCASQRRRCQHALHRRT